jgi:murein DD-endopeptidase MepM/ murein hydrolase activator NlpD
MMQPPHEGGWLRASALPLKDGLLAVQTLFGPPMITLAARRTLSIFVIAFGISIVGSHFFERANAAPAPGGRISGDERPLSEDMSGEGMLIPVAGIKASQLVDTFDQGRSGHTHHAIDILAPRGTEVLATSDGTIRKLFHSGDGGITIYEGEPSGHRMFYYAHLDRYADGLAAGAAVRRGEVIGYVGTTGNAPKNTPHLHFAVFDLPPSGEWWKGDAVDPYPLLINAAHARVAASAIGNP